MVTLIKILVAIVKIQIFIAKLFANYDELVELQARLEELLKQEEETTTE